MDFQDVVACAFDVFSRADRAFRASTGAGLARRNSTADKSVLRTSQAIVALRAAVLLVAFLCTGIGAAYGQDIRFASAAAANCKLKGIIDSRFDAPDQDMFAVLNKGADASIGIIQTSALAELKNKAAALGANRIIVRDLNSEGTITYHQRTGRGASWHGSKIVAEAYQC